MPSESATCSGRRVDARGDLGQAHPRPRAAGAVVEQHAHDRAVQRDVRVVRVRDRADRSMDRRTRRAGRHRFEPSTTLKGSDPLEGGRGVQGRRVGVRRTGGVHSSCCAGGGGGGGSADHSVSRSSAGLGSFQLGPSIVERRHGTQAGRGVPRAAACASRRSVRATSAATIAAVKQEQRQREVEAAGCVGLGDARDAAAALGGVNAAGAIVYFGLVAVAAIATSATAGALALAGGLDAASEFGAAGAKLPLRRSGPARRRRPDRSACAGGRARCARAG